MSRVNRDELNKENFDIVSTHLYDVDIFPFFGTLLGIHRNGKLIPGDDDIDFLTNVENKRKISRRLSDIGFNIDRSDPVNQTPYFLQFTRTKHSRLSKVDVGFIEEQDGIIKERVNWGFYNDGTLHIPKEYIYPLKEINFRNQVINFPNEPDSVCRYLYGKDWRQPMSDYSIEVIDNQPEITVYESKRTKALSYMLRASKHYDREGTVSTAKKTARFIYNRLK